MELVEEANGAAADVRSNASGNFPAVSDDERITGMEPDLYWAAVEGDLDRFTRIDENVKFLLTPNKNTVLHIHLTAQNTSVIRIWPLIFVNFPPSFTLFLDQLITIFNGKRHTKFVESILDKCPALVLQTNAKGETPLHTAVRYGNLAIVELLIERAKQVREGYAEDGIGVEKKLMRATDRKNDTALHEAVRYHRTEIVEFLTREDPSDHSYLPNTAGESPLYIAAERGFRDVVRTILKICKSPTDDGPIGRTALHAAVIFKDKEMVTELLNAEHLSDSVRKADKQGWIPLHHAAYVGSSCLTKLLLKDDRRNTAYIKDSLGRTAFHIAAHQGHQDVLKVLMKRCPDCSELVDDKGKNALHYAAEKNNILAVGVILENSFLSDLYSEKDDRGNTPLHCQANCQFPDTALQGDPRVDRMAFNNSGQTALDVADSIKPSFHSKVTKIAQLESLGARRGARREPILINDDEENEEMLSKEANESHLIVATLIATVSFAAGFSLPGGTIAEGKHQGSAMLGQRAAFKAFIITNTLALVMSGSAAFIHLFSSPKEGKSAIPVLRRIAFSFTLVAMAAMIMAFITGTYAVLGSSPVGNAVLAVGLSFFLIFHNVLLLNFEQHFLWTFIYNIGRILMFSMYGIALTILVVLRRPLLLEQNLIKLKYQTKKI